jgi:modulator of FtsH protease
MVFTRFGMMFGSIAPSLEGIAMNTTVRSVALPSSALATNKVLRNAYILLGLSLMAAAASATAAIATNAAPVHWLVFMLVFIGGPFLIARVSRSPLSLPAVLLYTTATGWFLGPIVNLYLTRVPGGESIVINALGTTAFVFVALSAYAMVSKQRFTFLRGFVFTGCLVLCAAIIANIFLQIPAFSLAISAAAVLLMSALILYRTSEVVHGGEDNYVMVTVDLFTSIYALFVHLLNLFGFAGGDD